MDHTHNLHHMKTCTILFFLLLAGGSMSAQITPEEAAAQIEKGINMGNTLEPPLEGGWNNPPAREIYFDLYRDAGFDLVRIPVRWDLHTGEETPFTVDPTWMQRVEQVVDWALERDLFVIINAHHDNWIKENYSNALFRARFDSIWSQVAIHFQDKSEKLMFEILNEPHGLTKPQNDELHARVLSIIRRSNPTRIVIIQGNEWGGAQELIDMAVPEDDFLIGSFHTYDPWPFGLEGTGPFGLTEIRELDEKFAGVKAWSDQTGIPVLLGEFGCHRDAAYNQRMKHYKTYTDLIEKYGFIFSVWDDGGNFGVLQRAAYSWNEIKDILIHATPQSPSNPKLSVYQDTLIRFTWGNVVTDYDSLVIERRTRLTTFEPVATISADSSYFVDLAVNPGRDYYYRVLGRYSNDSSIYSHPVTIFLPEYVEQERGYYLGEPLPVPGTIEAEYFDLGGEGKAYHDLDRTNIAGDLRPDEGVDIYSRLGEGYHVGNALPGEWLEYTLEIAEEADYLTEIHLAAIQSGGWFVLKIGDVTSDTLESISSGSWLTTSAVTTVLHLTPGIQIMRFSVIGEPLFNFDKIVFSIPEATKTWATDARIIVNTSPSRQLAIRVDGITGTSSIRILDIRGRVILHEMEYSPGERYITDPLLPGFYIIQASTDQGALSRKVAIP
jgi:aryl-phospho-beta-D-glucosidase BglC (GH1 family)